LGAGIAGSTGDSKIKRENDAHLRQLAKKKQKRAYSLFTTYHIFCAFLSKGISEMAFLILKKRRKLHVKGFDKKESQGNSPFIEKEVQRRCFLRPFQRVFARFSARGFKQIH
jgi:hypothetical protein